MVLNKINLETLLLGKCKQSEHNTSQKIGTRTNVLYDMNHLVSPHDASHISRNTNNSISATSSTHTGPRIINPCSRKPNSNAKSSSSVSASSTKIVNSDIKHLNSRSNQFIIDATSEEEIKAIKT